MPCNSDHMRATSSEIRAGTLFLVLDDIAGVPVSPQQWRDAGYDKRGYGTAVDCDSLAEAACAKLQVMTPEQIGGLSLETQMWWRDHQAADEARLRREHQARITNEERAAAIAKLTPYERRLLGIREDAQ